MKWLGGYRIKLLIVGFVFYSTLAFPELLLGQDMEDSIAGQESSEVVIMIADEEHRYQPRPDLGYVIMAQENADAIASIQRDFSLFTQQEVNYIGGRGRQGLRIVENRQSALQNKTTIKMLSTKRQIEYTAPLFSCNGSKFAVIPEIVVRVKSQNHEDRLQSFCRKVGCTILHPMEFTTQEYLLEVQGPNAEAVFMAVNDLNKIDWVEWAAPNIAFTPKPCGHVMPNDEYFHMQWHLHNTGELFGTPNADINAPQAWEITTGDPNVIIAVLDTGIDLDHPDLINNLVPGYDFHEDDNLPEPRGNYGQAHGTACAGLIAAEGNNEIGVTGVASKCKIMPIRTNMWDSYYVAPESEIATSIRWAATHGADILSNSWIYFVPLPIIHSAFVDVTQTDGLGRDGKGCIVVACSGNESSGVDYPASYTEMIAVGGTDPDDIRWNYSNYGLELDIVAPTGGWPDPIPMWTTDIIGSRGYDRDNFYDKSILDYTDAMSGTSGACPLVAGVAALILSIEPELTNEEVRHFLERSAKDLGDPGRDDYYGWGRVDARAALDMVLAKRCDLNNDWKVDDQDLAILNAAIDTHDLSADIAPPAKRDGIVDEKDLELLMEYLGMEIPELGLIAHWKLDETEGETAYDSIGVCDGVLSSVATWKPFDGMVGGALQLDGVDDYVATGSAPNTGGGAYSVLTWIRGGAPGQVVLSQTGKANWLCTDPLDGTLMTELSVGGRNSCSLSSEAVITDGNWHRIGFVWDGAYRRLYVDGVIEAEDVQDNLDISVNGLYFGTGKAMEPGTCWSGLIDDIRIYNRAVKP